MIDMDMKAVLLRCLAHVLTIDLVCAFCSPPFQALGSKQDAVFAGDYQQLKIVFLRLQEFGMGRVQEWDNEKTHWSALGKFARQ